MSRSDWAVQPLRVPRTAGLASDTLPPAPPVDA